MTIAPMDQYPERLKTLIDQYNNVFNDRLYTTADCEQLLHDWGFAVHTLKTIYEEFIENNENLNLDKDYRDMLFRAYKRAIIFIDDEFSTHFDNDDSSDYNQIKEEIDNLSQTIVNASSKSSAETMCASGHTSTDVAQKDEASRDARSRKLRYGITPTIQEDGDYPGELNQIIKTYINSCSLDIAQGAGILTYFLLVTNELLGIKIKIDDLGHNLDNEKKHSLYRLFNDDRNSLETNFKMLSDDTLALHHIYEMIKINFEEMCAFELPQPIPPEFENLDDLEPIPLAMPEDMCCWDSAAYALFYVAVAAGFCTVGCAAFVGTGATFMVSLGVTAALGTVSYNGSDGEALKQYVNEKLPEEMAKKVNENLPEVVRYISTTVEGVSTTVEEASETVSSFFTSTPSSS